MVHLRFQLELTCDCDVRTFPFDQLPSHVRLLKGYAWKPVCIQVSEMSKAMSLPFTPETGNNPLYYMTFGLL